MNKIKYSELIYRLRVWCARGAYERVKTLIENLSDEDKKAPEIIEILKRFEGSPSNSLSKVNSYLTPTPDYILRARMIYPNAYTPWDSESIGLLKQQFQAGSDLEEIATLLGRSLTGIIMQLQKMGLIPDADEEESPPEGDGDQEEDGGDEEESPPNEEDGDDEEEEPQIKGITLVCSDCGFETTDNETDDAEDDEFAQQEEQLQEGYENLDDDTEKPLTIEGHCPECGGLMLLTDIDLE